MSNYEHDDSKINANFSLLIILKKKNPHVTLTIFNINSM